MMNVETWERSEMVRIITKIMNHNEVTLSNAADVWNSFSRELWNSQGEPNMISAWDEDWKVKTGNSDFNGFDAFNTWYELAE